MTMRTHRHFVCPNQHKGKETTSENDQPYSQNWESVKLTNLKHAGKDVRGYDKYICSECGQPMTETP